MLNKNGVEVLPYPSLRRHRVTLKRLKKAYDTNFKLMVKYVGTPEHKRTIRREQLLNRMEVIILKALSIYIDNPCLIKSNKGCENCTGWFNVVETIIITGKRKGQKQRNYVCTDKGVGRECACSRYAGKTKGDTY